MTNSSTSLLTHSLSNDSPSFEWENGRQTIMDIGSQQIVCLMGRGREDGTLEVLGQSFVRAEGITNGAVTDINQANYSVRQALTNTEYDAKYAIKKITLGFSGGHPQSRLFEFTLPINKEQVQKADLEHAARIIQKEAHIQGRTILHIIPIEFRTNGTDHITNPLGHACQELYMCVHILYVDSSAIENLKYVMQQAEVLVSNIVYTPFMTPLGVLDKQERQQGSTVIDLGADLTNIAYMRHNRPIWSSQIKKGAYSITHDIALGLDMVDTEAEHIKTLYETPDASEKVNFKYHHLGQKDGPRAITDNVELQRIIVPRAKENLEEIEEYLKKAYENSSNVANCQEACQHIVITGGGALLDGIMPLAEDILIPSPFSSSRREMPFFTRKIYLGKPRMGHIKAGESIQPIFSAAIGLLIWALCKDKPYCDFMYPPQRHKSLWEKLKNLFFPTRRKV